MERKNDLMKKKTLHLITALILVLALVLTACGGEKRTSTTAADAAAATEAAKEATEAKQADKEEPEKADEDADKADEADEDAAESFSVALVLPGSVNDEGWNAIAYRGLKLIEEDGFKVNYNENTVKSDYEAVFRGYAEQGYDLIIGHGFEFFDPAVNVSKSFPETMFAVTSWTEAAPPNVAAINTNTTDTGFMSGVLAAKMTKSKIVAMIAGQEIPGITRYVDGFKQGVAYVDPEIKVLSTSTGSLTDTAMMKEVANEMIQQGADIIAPNGDQSAVGAFEAVNEAAEGIYVIGCNGDQSPLAPERTLSSSMIDFPGALRQVAHMAQEGALEADVYIFGAEQGSVRMADYLDVVPQDVRDYMDEVLEKFKKGEMDVEYPS